MAFVEERRGAGLDADGAGAARRACTPAAVTAASGELVKAGTLRLVGSEVFSASIVAALEQKLLAAIAEHHRASPMSEGLPREEARERLFGHGLAGVVRRRAAAAGRGRDSSPGAIGSRSRAGACRSVAEEARAQDGARPDLPRRRAWRRRISPRPPRPPASRRRSPTAWRSC